jgi:hypothetical protein
MDTRSRAVKPPDRASGSLLLYPLSLMSVAVLLLNDHVLKAAAPGVITGKLSDVAGLVFFPLLLVSVLEIVALRRRWQPSRGPMVLWSIAATAVVFILVKTTATGASVYAWTLGVAQWLVSLGPLVGRSPEPVVVVADPTDLLAVPAVLAAWWIAAPRHSSPPGRRAVARTRETTSPAGVLMLVVAGLASLASSPATPSESAEHIESIRLTADRPVAVRHLLFEVDNRDPRVSSVHLVAGAWTKEIQEGMTVLVPPRNVRTFLVPDEPAEGIVREDEQFEGPALDLTNLCSLACRHGARFVARLNGAPPAEGLDLEIQTTISALSEAADAGDALDVDLAVKGDDEGWFLGKPTSVVASVERAFRVSDVERRAHDQVRLRVGSAALGEPLAFPLVGRITIWVETAGASDHPNAHSTTIAIGEDIRYMVVEDQYPIDIDLLSRCEPSTDCEITISMDSEYDAMLNSEDFDPEDPKPGFVELRWFVEARLEAFDGRALPEDAVVLSVD